jgi:hypothetical protein
MIICNWDTEEFGKKARRAIGNMIEQHEEVSL